jgi:meso-butanediol dehydrogenase/(S,S)-butanediol dehydrogenase/diacetyl reductase
MGRLAGEVAIVTGSTSGLGAEIARRFAHEGAAVLVTGRDHDRGTAVAQQITENDGRALFVAADLVDATAGAILVDAAGVTFGPVTVLVNNAIAHVKGDGAVVDVTHSGWLDTLELDLLAPARLISAALTQMIAVGRGSIVNISSRAASHGTPNHAAYSAAKGALESLTRSVAVDYAAVGVRCNAVRPGYVLHELRDVDIDNERLRHIQAAQLTPPVTAADVAAACVWLASSEAAAITGLVLPVDGGSTATRAKVIG